MAGYRRGDMTMVMHRIILATLLAAGTASTASFAEPQHETSPLEFAMEYIRIQSDAKSSYDLANKEFTEAEQLEPTEQKMNSIMNGIIRNGTRVKIKLQFHIRMLQGMRINKKHDFGRVALIHELERKMKLWNEMTSIAKSFIEAGINPNPKMLGLAKSSSRVPEIVAEVESVEENIFKLVPVVVFELLHPKPDSQKNLSHLNITRAEANSLAETIRASFGESLNQNKDIKYPAAAAQVILMQISTKGYKYSDDPWE